MNPNMKSNLAIVLSVVAIFIAIYGGGGILSSQVPEGPEGFIKMTAKEAGLGSRSFDKCIADPAIREMVEEDIAQTQTIQNFAELQGIGTPFNLVVTDSQVIPVSGAYPYEFFDLLIKQINENGIVSDEILTELQIEAIDYALMEEIPGFDPETDHYKGTETPTITIIEYSDMECPFCARVHPTLQQIVDENINVAWVYRHLPLSFHPQAMPTAIAGECVAQEEGNEAFWQFTDTIFANQEKLQK